LIMLLVRPSTETVSDHLCRLAGRPVSAVATLYLVSDALIELSARLQETAQRLRSGELDSETALALVEDCARLASDASSTVDRHTRAALEPLPDLPGQLPLPAA
jgi:hypothetical protein